MTLGARVTVGIVGRISSCADAEAGPEFRGGGRAAPAAVDTQLAVPGPAQTVRGRVGVDPSASPAAGTGLWLERSAATGMVPTKSRATASTAGRRQLRRRLPARCRSRASSGDRNRASAERRAQAITRLARIAVLVQNSRVVGPINRTARMATTRPNATRDTAPSGTGLGAGIMK